MNDTTTEQHETGNIGWLKKHWLSSHAHMVFWTLFAGLMLLFYYLLHMSSDISKDYKEEARQKLAIAAQLYQIKVSAETGLYQLFVEGQPLQLQNDDVGPLGIGKLVTVKGVLANIETSVELYNQNITHFIEAFVNNNEAVEGKSNSLEIPLKNLISNSDGLTVINKPNADPYLHIDVDKNVFKKLPSKQASLKQIMRLVRQSKIYDHDANQHASSVALNASTLLQDTNDTEVNTGLININKAVKEMTPKLSYLDISNEYLESGGTIGQAVIKHFEGELEKLHEPLAKLNEGAEINCDLQNKCDWINMTVTQFQRDLVAVALGEMTFFWTFGHLLWLEVLLLVWLGVLTEGLTRLGGVYTRRVDANEIWDPRESARTLLKLAYAPPLAMVVIWTIFFTDLIEFESRISSGRSVYFVPVAFILGLFPNLGYKLLKDLAETIFRGTSIAKKRVVEVKINRAFGSTPVTAASAPSFDKTKESVKRHANAPLDN